MKLLALTADHILSIIVHKDHSDVFPVMGKEYADMVVHTTVFGATCVDNDKVMWCGGLARMWPGRYTLWGLFAKDSGAAMLRALRVVSRELPAYNGRIECVVKAGFAQGHRFARMLGFTLEAYHRRFLPDGSDAVMYVRFIR